MKKILNSFLLVFILHISLLAQDQDEVTDDLRTPGEHFSLDGALNLFKSANSIEEFEKLINEDGNKTNNLDMNGDGEVDYVKVIDKMDGDVHAIILQAIISETESQDIAVIEIEKNGPESATIQIIGDEDVYGEMQIVEPIEEEMTGGKSGPSVEEAMTYVVVNVWAWPSVRFVYAPLYRPWISPWKWRVYPNWWRPWRPLSWGLWSPHIRVFRPGFAIASSHRVIRAHRIYTPVRVHSVSVRNRHNKCISHYRTTRSTKVVGPRGTKVNRTKTTKVHTGPHGNKVKTTRTKTKVVRKK